MVTSPATTRRKSRQEGTDMTHKRNEILREALRHLHVKKIDLEDLIDGKDRYRHDKKMRDWCNEIINSNYSGSNKFLNLCKHYINAPKKKAAYIDKTIRELKRLSGGRTKKRTKNLIRKNRNHQRKSRRLNNRIRQR